MFNQLFGGEGSQRVLKWLSFCFVMLFVFLLVKVITDLKRLPEVGHEVYPQNTIVVTGEGESFAIPDIASFSFSVIESGKTVAAAQDAANVKINKALADIKAAGIEERDIQTTNYSVYPKYEWNQIYCITVPCPVSKNVLTGYEVNQTITVKVRDTSKAGDLVTKVGSLGASDISGIQFTVDNKDKYIAEARSKAIAKAKANAVELSKELGVKLGRILYFNEGGNYMPMSAAYGMGGGDMKSESIAAPATLPVGENKITSQISITYEVK